MDDLWDRVGLKTEEPEEVNDGEPMEEPVEQSVVEEEIAAPEEPEIPDTIVVEDEDLQDDEPAFGMEEEELNMDVDHGMASDVGAVEEAPTVVSESVCGFSTY